MYTLLIVDDEKIIRDGLYELLSMEETLELNLFSAASAVEAEKILEERKIDIVLTDINMPKKSGIELFDDIRERWPQCKVIFLTGYSEFDYVYRVQKQAHYILKAEEDEKIIRVVSEVIEEIENDFMIEQIVRDSSLLAEQKIRQEKNRFLNELFGGYLDPAGITEDLFARLGIPLDIRKKIFPVVMRHGSLAGESYDSQIRILGDLQLLLEKYFFDFMEGTSFHYAGNHLVMLLQPKKWESAEINLLTLKGKSELFQKACLKNFCLPVAVVIGSAPLSLPEVLRFFHSVKAGLLVAGEEALLVQDYSPEEGAEGEGSDEPRKNLIKSRLELLDYYFENSNRDHVAALLEDARDLFEKAPDMQDLFAVEIYSDIAIRLMRFINRFPLSGEMSRGMEVSRLFNVQAHGSWQEAYDYLIRVSDIVFDLKQSSRVKNNDDVIQRVKKYIHENLAGDTSLDTLADLVGFSPEYLLRLFKKSEGITVLQFINDLKIIKARKLIAERDRQIKEIAYELGFSSSGYFGRFFKSKTGLSPQGYRDQLEQE